MSKFLKFIVHFVLLCTIICVVALAVPPFYGVETVIIDDNSKVTNLELGSVTYAIPANINEVSLGTPLLVEDTVEGETKIYKYNLATVDMANGTGTVIDPDSVETENISVSIKNMVPKVVITVPYLGYLWVATQSIEGLIVLGLAILFMVILYVIAELWKKEPSEYDDDDDEYEEETYIKSEKELKKEEKMRAKRMKEEDKQLLEDAKEKKKKAKKEKKKSRKIIKTGGFVDEIYEDELQEEDETEVAPDVQSAASEAHELLKKEIAAATAEEPIALEEERELEKNIELETLEEKEVEKASAYEPEEIIRIVRPMPTATQLAAAAKKAGDSPDIVRDAITKVTLFDYSDIIGGEE